MSQLCWGQGQTVWAAKDPLPPSRLLCQAVWAHAGAAAAGIPTSTLSVQSGSTANQLPGQPSPACALSHSSRRTFEAQGACACTQPQLTLHVPGAGRLRMHPATAHAARVRHRAPAHSLSHSSRRTCEAQGGQPARSAAALGCIPGRTLGPGRARLQHSVRWRQPALPAGARHIIDWGSGGPGKERAPQPAARSRLMLQSSWRRQPRLPAVVLLPEASVRTPASCSERPMLSSCLAYGPAR